MNERQRRGTKKSRSNLCAVKCRPCGPQEHQDIPDHALTGVAIRFWPFGPLKFVQELLRDTARNRDWCEMDLGLNSPSHP